MTTTQHVDGVSRRCGRLAAAGVGLAVLVTVSCISVPTPEQQMAALKEKTGLEAATVEGATAPYLAKTHRGYPVLVRIQAGNVWGRYAARVAIGETGRELGGIWQFLTGSYEHGGNMTGSPVDRLLSRMIGQPISLTAILTHKKSAASRLDILGPGATVKPEDPLPKAYTLGLIAGHIDSANAELVQKLTAQPELVKRLKTYRAHYIRVDPQTAAFFFAGSENDYSGLIRDSGGYENLLNSIMESLADIADSL